MAADRIVLDAIDDVEQLARTGPRRKHILAFFGCTVGMVFLITSPPFLSAAHRVTAAAPQAAAIAAVPESLPVTAPVPEPTPTPTPVAQASNAACKEWCGRFWTTWCSALTECGLPFPSNVVQGMIEGGFSAQRAVQALRATRAKEPKDVPRAIQWALAQGGKEAGLAEFEAAREVRSFEHLDLDGYALRWGSGHHTATLEECAQACKAWKPVAPAWFVCNVYVFCPKPKCFAPAALPPGDMTGQCWLKHQDDPNRPQVNMKGKYTDAYRKSHPAAGEYVDWAAGVVVRAGTEVSTDTPSARANW